MDKRLLRIITMAVLALSELTAARANDTIPSLLPSVSGPGPRIGPNKIPPEPSVHEVARTTTLAGIGVDLAAATRPMREVAQRSRARRTMGAALAGARRLDHPGGCGGSERAPQGSARRPGRADRTEPIGRDQQSKIRAGRLRS
jgi:hypothetical protein